MRYYDWYRRLKYINFDNGDKYFGEVIDGDKKGYADPTGCGLYYTPSTGEISIYEKVTEKGENGMFMYSGGDQLILGYSYNGVTKGPILKSTADKSIVYSYKTDKDLYKGFGITIKSDGSYSIGEYGSDGYFTGKTISYKYGKLYFEIREDMDVEGEIINQKDVGWEYTFNYPYLGLPTPDFKRGIKPIAVKYSEGKKDYHYKYIGGVQTKEKDPKPTYASENSLREEFLDAGCGYGMMPYDNGDFYFGCYSNNVRSGLGFCRYPSQNATYMGSFNKDNLGGFGLLNNEKGIRIGRWTEGFKDGVAFEIKDDHMIIIKYDFNKVVGNYYKIYNDTLNVEEYDKDGILLNKYPFEKSKEKIEKLNPIDKIDPKIIKRLEDSGYEFKITKDSKIIIIKCNKDKKEEHVPSLTVGIDKEAYEGLKKIERVVIHDGVETLGAGCFKNCENIQSFEIGRGVSIIPELTCTSKKLKQLVIPKNVKRVKTNAFRFCQNLKKVWIKNPDCVIERDAFPYKCEIIRAEKEKKEEVKEIEKEKKNVSSNKKVKEKKVKNKTEHINIFKCIAGFFGSIFGVFKGLGKKIKRGTRNAVDGVLDVCDELSIGDILLGIVPTLVMITYVILLVTGVMDKITFSSSGFDGTLFGYNFELSGLMANWLENTDHGFFSAITLGLIQVILIVVGFVLDLVIHLLFLVLAILWFILILIFSMCFYYVFPVAIAVWSIINFFRVDEDRKVLAGICMGISVICCVSYFLIGMNII